MAAKKTGSNRPTMSPKVRSEAAEALRTGVLGRIKIQSLGGGALRQTEPRKIPKKKKP